MRNKTKNKKLTIAINAQIFSSSGGVEQVVVGLVSALGKIKDGEERYILITHPRNPNWLKPYLGRNMKIVVRPWRSWKERLLTAIVQQIEKKPNLGRFIRFLLGQMSGKSSSSSNSSDGFFELLGIDIIHFPTQQFINSQIPSVYNPHDLQHLHLPQFFTSRQIQSREAIYRTGCQNASVIGVFSQWVKNDIIKQYGTDTKKIFVIPWGPPTDVYRSLSDKKAAEVKKKLKLPDKFILYPAQTWPHKNHLRLLEAIAMLRDKKGLRINLICTGKKNNFWPTILSSIHKLNLEKQVRFLNFVSAAELQELYHSAQFVVIPTLFEAGSFPIMEAWREGTPVACSTVSSLPEQAGNGALLFNPNSVEDIAKAIYKMSRDADLRNALIKRGKIRVKQFNWEKTARMYRAVYRKVAGLELSEEDTKLLKRALF